MINILIISLFITNLLFAQNSIIDQYIKLGLENNLTLKEKEFSLQQSILDLDEARGMFFPSIDVKARYTRSDGGRNIDIPIGDLVNPIYSALNFLEPQFQFPNNISNESVPFLRKEEHETKVTLIQPIIKPQLFYNYSIKDKIVNIQNLEKKIFARKLISDIQNGYLTVLMTAQIIKLYENSLNLVNENLRINTSLFENDKITIDAVHRAKSEKLKIDQKILEAKENHEQAKSYLNFLLNQPLETPIEIIEITEQKNDIPGLEQLQNLAIKNREELMQFSELIIITEKTQGAVKSEYFPDLYLAAEYGFQGEKYKFTDKDDYWMASLVLNWNVFNGLKDKSKAEKAELELKKNMLQVNELKNKIKLQVQDAHKNLTLSKKIIDSIKEQVISSQKSFNIVKKKYEQGMISQIEYLDSQNELIESEISQIIAKYRFLENFNILEKVTSNIELFNYNLK